MRPSHTARARPCRSTTRTPSTVGERDAAVSRAGDDRRGERMLAAALEAGRQPQQRPARRGLATGVTDTQLRLALRQRAGLVDDERVDLAQDLDRLGVPEQHARRGALAASRP